MKSFFYQLITVLLMFIALAFSIPPLPSVNVGHGYDEFSFSRLAIGLVFLCAAGILSYTKLSFSKIFWLLFVIGYCCFSFLIHLRFNVSWLVCNGEVYFAFTGNVGICARLFLGRLITNRCRRTQSVLGQKHVGCARFARYYSPHVFAPKRGVIFHET